MPDGWPASVSADVALQDVAEQHAVPAAVGDGRGHVVDVLEAERLGAGDADDGRDLRDADGDGRVGERGAEHGGEADGQDQERNASIVSVTRETTLSVNLP
ncbi:hypothetical protein [Streptomyces sp. KL116D]|uniref:hypothetical protein n=1 Tax=Streptomyces sp. KL116D TaxID=3045152 RepID=UPI003556FEF2